MNKPFLTGGFLCVKERYNNSMNVQTVRIEKISITKVKSEIVVNAANEGLQEGGGVCGYIFEAAGPEKLQEACDKIGYCPTGSAVITPGFKLSKYIVHAVGPVWHGGSNGEAEKLRSCYRRSLELARENDCHSIAFPLISSGIFGYPVHDAWREAFTAISEWFKENSDYDMEIIFAVVDRKILSEGDYILKSRMQHMLQYYRVMKNDWKTEEMPSKNETFIYEGKVTEEMKTALSYGILPRQMEDKWFLYMEGNKLYVHRSWTGYCIYIIEFNEDGKHVITVNRDPQQYSCTDVNEDIKELDRLLPWWSEFNRTVYGERK